MDQDHLQPGFYVFRSSKLCPMRSPSPSMHLYPRWSRSVWDAEGIKVNQTQRTCIVLMLRRLIVCVQSVPVLLGRFLPQLLAVICMHSGRRFVLQRRIWPKYNFKGDAPPSVSSAGRIFAEREAFIFACCVTLGLLLSCTFWRILHFSPGLLLYSDVCLCLSTSDRCWYRDVEQQYCSTPACKIEVTDQEITCLLHSTPFWFHSDARNYFLC